MNVQSFLYHYVANKTFSFKPTGICSEIKNMFFQLPTFLKMQSTVYTKKTLQKWLSHYFVWENNALARLAFPVSFLLRKTCTSDK